MFSLAKVPAGRGQWIVSPTLSDLSLSCGVCEWVCVGVYVSLTQPQAKFENEEENGYKKCWKIWLIALLRNEIEDLKPLGWNWTKWLFLVYWAAARVFGGVCVFPLVLWSVGIEESRD